MYDTILGFTSMSFWLVLTVVLAVFEIMTLGLSTIWFAIGALCAFVASLLGASIPMQIVIFIVVSVVALLLVRPLSVKYFNNRVTPTNIDAVIGRKVKVTKVIDNDNETGTVTMDGSTWNARNAADDGIIEEGSTVTVQSVEGNKLFVTK
jgi:membrane protein implicated in regulation of membrane protease activity